MSTNQAVVYCCVDVYDSFLADVKATEPKAKRFCLSKRFPV